MGHRVFSAFTTNDRVHTTQRFALPVHVGLPRPTDRGLAMLQPKKRRRIVFGRFLEEWHSAHRMRSCEVANFLVVEIAAIPRLQAPP